MKHSTPLLGSRLAIALLMLWTASISGCGQADKQNQNKPKPTQSPATPGKQGVGPVAKELDPKVVEAWRQAGAKVGWYGRAEDGGDRFCETKPNDVAAVPALRWRAFEAGIIVKLPAPSAPFALSLSHTEVADAGLKELAGLTSLQTLALHGTQVTDAGLKELAGLKSLQSLGLGNTKVTDAGLKELAGLKSLQSLDIWETKVTDVGLKELVGLTSLQTLGLQSTQVTDAGLKELPDSRACRVWASGTPR